MAEDVAPRRKRVISFIWLVAFVGAGAFFSTLLTQAVKERQCHEVKRTRVASDLEAKRDGVERLRLEKDAVINDPIYVEGVARKDLKYSKKDEVSYPRENVKLQKVGAKEKDENASPLSALVDAKLTQWQIPITVLAVIIIALVIVRGFGPKEEDSDAEGAE